MNGWIKLHRKITEWEWYTDGNTMRVFLHLLLMANHAPSRWMGMPVGRGQVVTGRKVLAESLNLGEQSIRTSLKRLKSTNEITIKSTSKYSLITIIKYDDYQINDVAPNQVTNQVANQQLTNMQPTTNHKQELKKDKKEKKSKNNIIMIFEDELAKRTFTELEQGLIREFFTERHKRKRYQSKRGVSGLLDQAEALRDCLAEAVKYSLDREYQTIFAKPAAGSFNGNGTSSKRAEREKRSEENLKLWGMTYEN